MRFPPLVRGVLHRRYQRFLADVKLADGREVTAHCPNTGAMTGMADPGSTVWLSESDNPARKLRWTLELVETPSGLACVHSSLANTLVGEALADQRIPPLAGNWQVRTEVRLPGSARVDFVLSSDFERVIIEVKAVTLATPGGLGLFPDAPSERARKHVEALAASHASGARAVLLFCVLHAGIDRVAPAEDIDPLYTQALRQAAQSGVEVLACGCTISTEVMEVRGLLPVEGVLSA